MTLIDRRYSVAEGTAVKAPCRAATTANITLSGEQTIDGVAVVEGDRVLVKNQTTGSQNGIYSVSTGNWTRTRDFDGAFDIVSGTRVFVTSGTVSAQVEFYVTTADPIVVDTTSIAFSAVSTLAVQVAMAIAAAINLGWTGPATFAQTVAITGNLSVNTNKFTVTASSGNTLVAGTFDATGAGVFASTLSATGNFAINTNKFNVTAASGNTTIAGTLAVTGTTTVAAVASSSSVLSSSASAGIGYATGAGGTVSQATNKSTGVTLNTITGQITTTNTNISSQSRLSFTLTNSAIGANDGVLVWIVSGAASPGQTIVTAQNPAAGSVVIAMSNITAIGIAETLVIGFAVIKAVTA
jgi:uncharacterized cupin superfamily protein